MQEQYNKHIRALKQICDEVNYLVNNDIKFELCLSRDVVREWVHQDSDEITSVDFKILEDPRFYDSSSAKIIFIIKNMIKKDWYEGEQTLSFEIHDLSYINFEYKDADGCRVEKEYRFKWQEKDLKK